ncbi:F-box domain protein [Aspergillus sclerotiicarbonarius CBS 121057]|uniref:F-box domain protein n=1 Tax=Aspergillus sclerotiicarbonarius (strain CBS 121057 / IBT 28362) TaxID=1448318 RepID=A0A319EPM3_ASPSB|nr:F-box domain protein [Aspergillus sclerotiicarbonarius CBS 121057]
MEKLPVEILCEIIDYLTPHERVQLQSVSRRLFSVARDNNLWRLHCFEESWSAPGALRSATNRTSGSLVSNSTASLRSLGQTSLRSLIQPGASRPYEGKPEGLDRAPSYGQRSRAAGSWDPSYEGEEVNWYSEYIARNGPLSLSWMQQPFTRVSQGGKREYREVKGMGLLRDWSSARQNKVVAPLDDGSVCIWDLNHSHSIGSQSTKGKVLGVSSPGILMANRSGRRDNSGAKQALEFVNLGECVSVDSMRRRAYLAVGNILNEVDLETLSVISQQRFPWSVFALSQETDYSVPLTLATTLSLHIYDGRMSATEEEEAINLRCEEPTVSLVPKSQIYAPPDSPLLQLQPNGRPPHRIRSPDPSNNSDNYAPLFQPGPLSLLHPPAPHVNSIFLAGRFPSILQYDRRFFPRLQNTIHSGGQLCGLAAVPAPRFPVFSNSEFPTSHKLVACGDYKGRGSLELYNLTPSGNNIKADPSGCSSSLSTVYQNRQSVARSKVLSVESHGTRIVYSDADGNIKWVERDGRAEVRRLNINAYQPQRRWYGQPNGETSIRSGTSAGADGEDGDTPGLWGSLSRSRNDGEVARKVLPTGGSLTGDELLVWTGEHLGRIRFSNVPDADLDLDDEDEDMAMDGNIPEAEREARREKRRDLRQREEEYATMMRKALERQADEVRRMGGLGL